MTVSNRSRTCPATTGCRTDDSEDGGGSEKTVRERPSDFARVRIV